MSKLFIRTWIILLVIIAAYIRVHGTMDYHYNPDEAMILDIAKGKDLNEVVNFSLYETHPPLFYLLLHYWLMVFDDPAWVRGLSLLVSIGTIPLYFAIGKKLNGELTGLLAATLITFSFGLISQSCLVRQYNLLVFFISSCFYYYLYWHDTRSKISLGGYLLFGILACLTHFSALFTLLPIAAAETIYMVIRKTPWQQQLKWIVVNMVMVAVLLGFFWLNQSSIAEHTVPSSFDFQQLPLILACAILSLLYSAYILPFANAMPIWVFLLPVVLYYCLRKRRFYFLPMWLALGLEMFLKASAIYPYGKRHDLWLTPFVITPLACMLADLTPELYEKYSKNFPWHYGILSALFIIGILSYNPQSRFSDSFEYLLKQNDWQNLNRYIASLDASHFIITERDDAFLLKDPSYNYYDYISPSTSDTSYSAVILPLNQARLMSNEFYQKMYYKSDTFIQTMEEALHNGSLDGFNTLVFARSSWYKPVFRNLFLCTSLNKKMIFFPPLVGNATPSTNDILLHTFIAVEINKKTFFKDYVSKSGPAHSCLLQAKQ